MSKVAIITDSTSYIPKDLVEKYRIHVAPQVLIWGEETFLDGIDIQPVEFYTRLKTAAVMPTTSQVTIATFKEMFTQLLEEGYDILALLISVKLSGTIDSALQARDMLPKSPIEIVDSQATAMALGFQVLSVARAVQDGANLAEAKALAEAAIRHSGVVFAVDTLEFLHRGGRIGGGTRFLGTALNIKPILELRDGRVEAVERVRTRKKSLTRLVDMVEERVKGRQPLRLATLHANAHQDASVLLEEANRRLEAIETVFSEVSPVVGTHAGPGTVGLAYMAGM
ncbi:MAG: DegV family protein [Anaerolineales bacterium]|nr:DegV family protein [Anaerolineales bacterium]